MGVLKMAVEQLNKPSSEWISKLEPWDILIEKARELWGEHWAFYRLANLSASLRSKTETGKGAADLLDRSSSLCQRVRYARLRSGASRWWKKQLLSVESTKDQMFVLLVMLVWSSAPTIGKLVAEIDSALRALSEEEWSTLIQTLASAHEHTARARRDISSLDVSALPAELSTRTIVALVHRAKDEASRALVKRYLSEYDGTDPLTLKCCENVALRNAMSDSSKWAESLALIKRAFAAKRMNRPTVQRGVEVQENREAIVAISSIHEIPARVAETVMEHPDEYPPYLVNLSETHFRKQVGQNVVPVANEAEREKWFSEPPKPSKQAN
jgi:hypothetical protein